VTTGPERFDDLFSAHYAALTRYAARRVGVDAAPEVVAETFLVAWRRLDDVPSNALPWLYGTARRIVANEYRRRDRANLLAERIAGEGRRAPNPDHADEVIDRIRVWDALERLSLRDREVLQLAEWEQLAPKDAAAVMSCSVAAYKVRLHRARRRLSALLANDVDAAPEPPHAHVPTETRGITP
jgi:RNA polymerase sigma-70 factor, ECF subfamily